ncbi:hypothetical protein BG015_009075 [Linnemannia schmuckeri]|uniref:ADP-ribosylation factor n=1 Tax=Linnemannia schmuckeri TaxID=64567 RepID=A0A9P5VA09_9FUNG|nr:hypothetical protein BG015_009075 [Linnemannia schmuckeri]
MVGVEGGGKTTILYQFLLDKKVSTISTYGFNLETVTISATQGENDASKFILWDLGGSRTDQWQHYTQGAVDVVYVVDSSDEPEIDIARDCLWMLFEDTLHMLKDAVLLVFANKQDRLNALSVTEVKDRLDLMTRGEGRQWHIQGSSATTGDGIMEGPAGSGKTSLLYRLFLGEVVTTIPTCGFNMENFNIHGTNFALWDLAGSWFSRVELWSRYTDGIVAMIFVVDSTDVRQIRETKTAMWRYYRDYDEHGVEQAVMLVFANKQDCHGAMTVADMKDYLELETRAEGRRWHIRGCVATTAEGVVEGLKWVVVQVNGVRPAAT